MSEIIYLDRAVEVPRLKKRVKDKAFLSLPMLPTKSSSAEFHIVRSLDMVVREIKRFAVPSEESALVSGAQINQFHL